MRPPSAERWKQRIYVSPHDRCPPPRAADFSNGHLLGKATTDKRGPLHGNGPPRPHHPPLKGWRRDKNDYFILDNSQS